jgi:hypothetical protein
VLPRIDDTKHILRKLRIDLGQHRRDGDAQQPQGIGGRCLRDRHLGRAVEIEAGVLGHLLDPMTGMDAGEAKAPPRAAGGAREGFGARAANPSDASTVCAEFSPCCVRNKDRAARQGALVTEIHPSPR